MDLSLSETDNDYENHADLFRMDQDRLNQVDENQKTVAELLDEMDCEGLLLTFPENFSWFTCGGDCRFNSFVENPSAALYITHTGRVILTHDSISPQLFDKEVGTLGFQLKERNWREPLSGLFEEITRGRAILSDSGMGKTRNICSRIAQMRAVLSPYLKKRWQKLGELATYAVEATCRNIRSKMTEAEVAGEIAHRLIKREILPVQIQILADDRFRRYRQWSYSQNRIEKRCLVNLVARKFGIHFSVSRSVSLITLTPQQQQQYQLAGEAFAEILDEINSDTSFYEVWHKTKEIYKAKKISNSWRSAEFAWRLGYQHPEQIFKPQEENKFLQDTPWYWQNIVGSTMIGQSLIVTESTPICFENGTRWRLREFQTKQGSIYQFPEILERRSG